MSTTTIYGASRRPIGSISRPPGAPRFIAYSIHRYHHHRQFFTTRTEAVKYLVACDEAAGRVVAA